jgi:hypothetical protein
MNKILVLAILIGTSITSAFSQSEGAVIETLHIDSVFQDKTTDLLFSKVIQMDSLSQSDIKERVKNWAGKAFVNMNEVLVSETESQLVFNYIESYSFRSMGMPYVEKQYTRIIVNIKDNRLKVSFYDDGNVFRLGAGSAPSVPSRTQFMKDYFRKDTIIENKGLRGKIMFQCVDSYQRGVNSTMKSFESGIKEVAVKKEDSDF